MGIYLQVPTAALTLSSEFPSAPGRPFLPLAGPFPIAWSLQRSLPIPRLPNSLAGAQCPAVASALPSYARLPGGLPSTPFGLGRPERSVQTLERTHLTP